MISKRTQRIQEVRGCFHSLETLPNSIQNFREVLQTGHHLPMIDLDKESYDPFNARSIVVYSTTTTHQYSFRPRFCKATSWYSWRAVIKNCPPGCEDLHAIRRLPRLDSEPERPERLWPMCLNQNSNHRMVYLHGCRCEDHNYHHQSCDCWCVVSWFWNVNGFIAVSCLFTNGGVTTGFIPWHSWYRKVGGYPSGSFHPTGTLILMNPSSPWFTITDSSPVSTNYYSRVPTISINPSFTILTNHHSTPTNQA